MLLSSEMLRMNVRLQVGLPLEGNADGTILSDDYLQPLNRSLAEGLNILVRSPEVKVDEIRLAHEHCLELDRTNQGSGVLLKRIPNAFETEELTSCQWRSQMSFMMCHKFDWKKRFEQCDPLSARHSELSNLFDAVVKSELDRGFLGQLPVLRSDLLKYLQPHTLESLVEGTLSRIIGAARMLYSGMDMKELDSRYFFRFGMANVDEQLDDMMERSKILYSQYKLRYMREDFSLLEDSLGRYYAIRDSEVAQKPGWHYKQFTTDLKEAYSKRI